MSWDLSHIFMCLAKYIVWCSIIGGIDNMAMLPEGKLFVSKNYQPSPGQNSVYEHGEDTERNKVEGIRACLS